jgi:hypothetical protein
MCSQSLPKSQSSVQLFGSTKAPNVLARRKWIDNIKMDLLEIGLNVLDWIGLAQDRYKWRPLVNAVMNFRVP